MNFPSFLWYNKQKRLKMEDFFHVHTRRCKHGSEESDETLVKKAISLGAKRITFTDHVPFPENPFGNRMDFEELEDYLDSLEKLKKLYATQIDIKIGFEVEYLPKYFDYFWFLKNHPKVDLLICGQHMAQYEDTFTCFLESEKKNEIEHRLCVEAMIEGIKSGLFDVVAHPDRCFKRQKEWTEELTKLSNRLFSVASEYGVSLEINISSYTKQKKNVFRKDFWLLLEEFNKTAKKKVQTVFALDSHSTEEMESHYNVKVEI